MLIDTYDDLTTSDKVVFKLSSGKILTFTITNVADKNLDLIIPKWYNENLIEDQEDYNAYITLTEEDVNTIIDDSVVVMRIFHTGNYTEQIWKKRNVFSSLIKSSKINMDKYLSKPFGSNLYEDL